MSVTKYKYVNTTREIILSLIDNEKVSVFLYGSRATGQEEHGSDIDIGLWSTEKIDKSILRKINEAIEESIVPYRVDVVDFTNVDENFKKTALKKIEIWNKGRGFSLD